MTDAYARDRTLHVAVHGDDANEGSQQRPFRSIQAAAQVALPGDTVLVHAGTYRERVDPPRGGESEDRRITYRAAPGELVTIKGSEPIKGWSRLCNDTWHVAVPNCLFGDFNPYSDLIQGDWFVPKDRQHHTGAVYLEGEWLHEAASLQAVLAPLSADQPPLWFAHVDAEFTLIWAQFKHADPNQALVEINVRQSVFYPSKPGIDYLTVQGFTLSQAATPWAPPTAEQIALLGTHWSQGWQILDNRISHSRCCGISLGKYGDEHDNTSQWSADGYVHTILRAQQRGWGVGRTGGHLVRGNTISHCEQAGIVGSLGCNHSTITENTVHDIHVIAAFDGHEQAGIKFHGAIDTVISHNHVYNTVRGLWLDWMTQGTQVLGNLFHDNLMHDVFLEVNHGPFLFAHNVFLSANSLDIWSNGGAYVDNLLGGKMSICRDQWQRWTPYMKAHSTEIEGLKMIGIGDDRWINNVFLDGVDMSAYADADMPVLALGNVYAQGAKAIPQEAEVARFESAGTMRVVQIGGGWRVEGMPELAEWQDRAVAGRVDSELLGRVNAGGLGFAMPVAEGSWKQTFNLTNPSPIASKAG